MGAKIQFAAEFKGAPINQDGLIEVRLRAPFSETGEVARLLLHWTKQVRTTIARKKRNVSALFLVKRLDFRPDGTSQVNLQCEAQALGETTVKDLAAMKQKVLTVTVELEPEDKE